MVDTAHILVVDDEPDVATAVSRALRRRRPEWEIQIVGDGVEALEHLQKTNVDVVVSDVYMPRMNGFELLERVVAQHSQVPVVLLTSADMVEKAVEAMRAGAFDYQVKPLDVGRLETTIDGALARGRARREADRVVDGDRALLVGASTGLKSVLEDVRRVRDSSATVLVVGETGTGKELVSRAIHDAGARSAGPFVAINCGAIPENLQESQLFGHERGSFTGAHAQHKGVFERAHGGTLLLDEVGELSASAQARLLRVLQHKVVHRIGSEEGVEVDVRVVSATNKDLRAMVATGAFREDLYYRLVVYPIVVPPLRARSDDIPELVRHFVFLHATDVGGRLLDVTPDAIARLQAHPWPGNVRELENVVRRAMLISGSKPIDDDAVREAMAASAPPQADAPSGELSLRDVERVAVERALEAMDWNVTATAKHLGISRATLYRKIRAFGLER